MDSGKSINDYKKSSTRIVFKIDMVGYSKFLQSDNKNIMDTIQRSLQSIKKIISESEGEIHSSAGDSFLSTFYSINNALSAAFKIQDRRPKEDKDIVLNYRIGIHLGEVYELSGDIAGNAVNIAARLEALAPEGGICISSNAWTTAPEVLRARFVYAGQKYLKNIAVPVNVYHFNPVLLRAPASPQAYQSAPQDAQRSDSLIGGASRSVDLGRGRPAVLVRPLRVLSHAETDLFFAEGFVADLMMRLSRFRRLDVIGRDTSAAVGAEVSDLDAARIASVRYVVTGHFQRVGHRMRLGVTLTDILFGKIIWSEIYDRSMDDFFAVQTTVADEATAAMAVQIEKSEERLARARDPADLDAYTLVVRGRLEDMEDGAIGRDATDRALRFFSAAAERDKTYSAAVAGMARAVSVQWRFGWCDDKQEAMALATDLAIQAIAIDDNDSTSHAELGFVSLYNREHDRAVAAYERALQLNPSDVDVIAFYADALKHAGHPRESIPFFKRAIRLNPLHPDIYLGNMAHAYFVMQDFETAILTIKQMRQQLTAQRVLTASLMLSGREEEGRMEASRLRTAFPEFSATEWCKIVPDRLHEHTALLQEGLERAGF